MAVRFSAGTAFYSATTGLPAGNVYTVTFWFYNTTTTSGQAVWYMGAPDIEFGTINGTTYELYDSISAAIGPGTTLAANTWHCVGIVVNGGTATVYEGNSPTALSSTSGSLTPANASNAMRIGTDVSSQPLNGRVGAFKMWAAALSAAEIAAELTQSQPIRTTNLTRYHPFHVAETTDRSGNGNTLTLNGAPTTEPDPPVPESGNVVLRRDPPGRIAPQGRWAPLVGDATFVAAATANPAADVAAGTGQAGDATVAVAPVADVAAGTGAAGDVQPNVAPAAGNAAGTGAALQPTVTASGNANANAGNAAGAGQAFAATVTVSTNAGSAAGTGAANNAATSVSVAAGNATGSGQAFAATITISPAAGSAAGTGAARNPVMPLTQWRAAIATVGSTPARWVAIGDSVTEGAFSSTAALRWTRVLLTRFRTVAGLPVGGDGTIPGWVEPRIPAWANSQVTSTGTTVDLGPFGYRDVTLATGQSSTYTFTGTKIQIWYQGVSGGGSFTYTVDGGGSTTVSTAQGSTAYIPTALIDLGGGGSHTVVISYLSGATVTLAGIEVFNGDHADGITFYDGGRTDITAGDYVGGGGRDYSLVKPAWDLMAPDLVTIELGLNEALNSISTSTMTTNITTLVTDLRALSKPPSIVVVAAYSPDQAVVAASTWATYVAALSSFVAGHPGDITFIDLSALMPQATTSGTGFYATDGLHPNDAGHAEIARLLQNALLPPAATSADQAPLPIHPPGRVSPRGQLTPFPHNVAWVQDTQPAAGLATGTGVAQDPAAAISPAAGAATGAGAANAPTANVGPSAGAASGTGTAQAPTLNVEPNAGNAAGTGAAMDPTVTVVDGQLRAGLVLVYTPRPATARDIPPGLTLITPPAVVAVDASAPAGGASGSGVAQAPTVTLSAAAGVGTAAGAATTSAVSIAVNAGNAAGAGAALAATTSSSSPGQAGAQTAQAAGAAKDPTVATAPNIPAGVAAGVGAAQAPTAAVATAAAAAAAAGAAAGPTATPAVPAGNAVGAGTAQAPTPSVAFSTSPASGPGAAQAPTVTVSTSASAAGGTGAAPAPTVNLLVATGLATGTGSARQPSTAGQTTDGTAPATSASAAGSAWGPRVIVSIGARPAHGAGATHPVRMSISTGGHSIRPSTPTPPSTRPRDRAVLVRPTNPASGGPTIRASSG